MITFSTAQKSQSHEITNLVNSAYRGDSSKKGWTTEADILGGQRTDPQGIEEMIAQPGALLELARSNLGELLGCVFLKIEPALGAVQSCYLGMLTVLPTDQGRGLGKTILEHAEHVAVAHSCTQIRMTVITVREELIQYYLRRGYFRTGFRSPFPHHDPRFGEPKVENLEFEELVKIL